MKPLESCGMSLQNPNPIFQLWTIAKISTRTFVINRHTCHRYIYPFFAVIYLFLLHARLLFPLKRTCFRRFSFSFGGFGHFAIKWSLDPHLKHFKEVRSIHLWSEAPATQYFSFSCLILFEHFSAEWLVPPHKFHFVGTVFDLSIFLPKPELISRFK